MSARARSKESSQEVLGSEKTPLVSPDVSGTGRQRLLRWNGLPEWRKNHKWVLTGYLPLTGSYLKSITEAFTLHNETLNIHTHLVGAILFVVQLAGLSSYLRSITPKTTWTDVAGLGVYLLGTTICFLLSSTYHTLQSHSKDVAIWASRLDYTGILALMWGASVASIYYGFYNEPGLRMLHWTITSGFAGGCLVLTLGARFRAFHLYRALMYSAFFCSGILFVLHSVYLYGYQETFMRMSLGWMGRLALFNGIGVAFYASRFPERYFPETFDIFGASHQLFHSSIVVAAISHVIGLIKAFRYAKGV